MNFQGISLIKRQRECMKQNEYVCPSFNCLGCIFRGIKVRLFVHMISLYSERQTQWCTRYLYTACTHILYLLYVVM